MKEIKSYDKEIVEKLLQDISKDDNNQYDAICNLKSLIENAIESIRVNTSLTYTEREAAQTEIEEIKKIYENAVSKCNEQVQEKLVLENPLEYFTLVDATVQEKVMPLLDEDSQRNIINKKPQLIVLVKDDLKKEILMNKRLNDECWQIIIKNEPNLDLEKLYSFSKGSYYEYRVSDFEKEIVKYFENLKDKNSMVSQIRNFDIVAWKQGGSNNIEETREDILKRLFANKHFSLEVQPFIIEILIENSDFSLNDSIREQWLRLNKNIIYEKFSERYGQDKLEKYKDIIESSLDEKNARLLEMLFVNEGIIKNVSPNKILNYIELQQKLEKNSEVESKPLSLIAEIKRDRKILKQQFDDIIFEAYGEKSRDIVASRPGLTLKNIHNTEILNKNITENFRMGFVHDLLSYNIDGINDFIRISKNSEELEAFKLLYNIMSEKLGENVTTMQMCILRFPKYVSLLKDAQKQNLDDISIENLAKVCSWPINLCGIKSVSELNNLPQKFQNAINQKTNVEDTPNIITYDFMNMELVSEVVLFDYLNPEIAETENLSDYERKLLLFFQHEKIGFKINNWKDIRQATENNIDISSIFLDQYIIRKKIKENQMKGFNTELTNIEKIHQAEKEGIYGTKTLKIGDIELIDFGSMPVNLASHDPTMNESDMRCNMEDIRDQYLTYDGSEGISTISARPLAEETGHGYLESGIHYLYWDFKDNEIMALYANDRGGDAKVSHEKKLVKSYGGSTTSIKRI